MREDQRSATASYMDRVTRAVDEEFFAAALARWESPSNVFLWRSRRCVEAMLYMLLLEQKADVAELFEKEKTLETLFKHEKLRTVMAGERGKHFDIVRQYGNTGTHFQLDGDAGANSAKIAASALEALIEWFYTRNSKPVPPNIAVGLAALSHQERRIRSKQEEALARAEERVQQLDRDLSAQRDKRRSDVTRGRSSVPLAVVGVLALAGAFAAGRWGFSSPTAPSDTLGSSVGNASGQIAPPAPTRAPPPSPVLPSAPTEPAGPGSTAVQSESDDTRCPPGTTEVAAATDLVLRPIANRERPPWRPPAADNTARRFSVPRHCLQDRPVRVADYLQAFPSMRTEVTGCVVSRNDDDPMGCLFRDEAADYCRQWHTDGVLPTTLSWEAASRQREWSPRLPPGRSDGGPFEWARDAFPASWLGRGNPRAEMGMMRAWSPPQGFAADAAHESWHAHTLSERIHNLYFRCAWVPDGRPLP